MAKTNAHSDNVLNVLRNTTLTAPANVYAGLLTAVTTKESASVTETTYTGYARVAVTFGAPAAGGGGRQVANSSAVTFGQKTDAGSVTIVAVGIYDAITAGNLWYVIYLDGGSPIVGTLIDTTNDDFISAAHGLAQDDRVVFEIMPGTGALPAPIAEDTVYWVIAAGLTADQFRVSTTQGGGAVNVTAAGRFVALPLTPVTVNQNDTPEFATGQLVIQED